MTLAMKRVPSLRMLWIGDGPQRAATERAVARSGCGDRQCFVGAQPVIESYLGALDFLVAPSLVSETFGRVVAEAQACGVPVVASRLGGMTEAFLPGESGVLVESPSDAVALSNAIEQMALDPAQRARMGTVGAEFVLTHFSADHIASAFLASLAQCAPLTPIERRLATPFRQTAAGNG
jgi:glycosyltransferase involved in cell wall biosynthesis